MRVTKLCAALLVVLASSLGGARAGAETKNCTVIAAVPAVITAQGTYCFTQDLSTSMLHPDHHAARRHHDPRRLLFDLRPEHCLDDRQRDRHPDQQRGARPQRVQAGRVGGGDRDA